MTHTLKVDGTEVQVSVKEYPASHKKPAYEVLRIECPPGQGVDLTITEVGVYGIEKFRTIK